MRGENHVSGEPIPCVVVERDKYVEDIWEVQSVFVAEHPEEVFCCQDILDGMKAELRYPGTFQDGGHRRIRVAKIVFDDSYIIDDTYWKLPEDEAQRIKALVSGKQHC